MLQVPSGGAVAASSGGAAPAAGGAAAAEKEEEKKEEEKVSSLPVHLLTPDFNHLGKRFAGGVRRRYGLRSLRLRHVSLAKFVHYRITSPCGFAAMMTYLHDLNVHARHAPISRTKLNSACADLPQLALVCIFAD